MEKAVSGNQVLSMMLCLKLFPALKKRERMRVLVLTALLENKQRLEPLS